MKKALAIAITAAMFCFAAPSAWASFGLEKFDVTYTNADGSPATQAGSHPFAMTTTNYFNKLNANESDGEFKDGRFEQIAGLVADKTAFPRCSTVDFLTFVNAGLPTQCLDSAAVGYAATELGLIVTYAAVYNLEPAPGEILKLGFVAANTPITIDVGLDEHPPYNGYALVTNTPQTTNVLRSQLTLWGNPADPAHDPYRGYCVSNVNQPGAPVIPEGEFPSPPSYGECETNVANRPLLTLPRACQGPLSSSYAISSWQGGSEAGSVLTHDDASPPTPLGMTGCSKLAFAPSIAAQPTSRAAESSSGLDFSLDTQDPGLTSPDGLAASDLRKTVVTLPEGMTANPSSANGLGVCSEAQLGQMTAFTGSAVGCPDASKLGTVEVETPILDETLKGSLFLAKPYENEFGTLLALYMVVQDPTLGIFVSQPMKVEPDPVTGRLVTTADDIIQAPISHIRVHFREGARSPLVTPPDCGSHDVEATLYPWSGGAPVEASSGFEIVSGSNGGPCPSGGEPFDPGFEAGSLNNAAGHYSQFDMRLTRKDGDQDLTKFSAKLPPGMIGKLAGTSECPAAAIAQARSRTGEHGGEEEKNSPSCPADSRIGSVEAGAGVGSILTWVPGDLYLAGPYNGAPLSVVAIVPALAGPFDAGTVVTQEALRINPLTAEVEADGSSSDPIPHILKGIPLKVRDIRVHVDKPEFTLNPTSCEESATEATIWSGGSNVFSTLDDSPHSLAARFQAADCASLGFKPNLKLTLRGSSPKRGGHPALRGVFTPRQGDANLKKLVLRLPHSAFLDQAHIRTICTRVQFAAGGGNGGGCPAAAIYGHATAWTPLLSEPLSGPVYLRSSNHNLPDFVAALHGKIDVEAVARIDSKNGGIRATFPVVPDAPLSRVVVNMQGAKKGLIINSKNLCYRPGRNRANARFFGHNGRRAQGKPVVRAAKCGKARKKKHKRHHERAAG